MRISLQQLILLNGAKHHRLCDLHVFTSTDLLRQAQYYKSVAHFCKQTGPNTADSTDPTVIVTRNVRDFHIDFKSQN